MDSSLSISINPANRSKESFISQAHEARLARQLERRKEIAATTIQAHLRSFMTRRKLKCEILSSLSDLLKLPQPFNAFQSRLTIRKVLYYCDKTKDRACYESIMLLILRLSISIGNSENGEQPKPIIATETLVPVNESSNSFNRFLINSPEDRKISSVIYLLSGGSTPGDDLQFILIRLLDICIDYINSSIIHKTDSEKILIYLQIFNLIIPDQAKDSDHQETDTQSALSKKLVINWFDKNPSERRCFLQNLLAIVFDNPAKMRKDLRPIMIDDCILLVLKLFQIPKNQNGLNYNEINREEILTSLLSFPGLLSKVEEFSPKSLERFDKYSIFDFFTQSFYRDADLTDLTSSGSICLMANSVHLASLNEKKIPSKSDALVNFITKMLLSCRKNMLKNPSSQAVAKNNPIDQSSLKKNECRNVFFNPILGWIAREQALTIDKEIIRSQLTHLWSMKILMLLFSSLAESNKENTTKNKNRDDTHSQNSLRFAPKYLGLSFIRKSSLERYEHCNDGRRNLLIQNSQNNLLRRVVNTVGKSLNSSYLKSSGTNTNTISTKIITDEVKRIASVCFMYHLSLNTLTALKQEILTGLCGKDYLLPNLWIFICQLNDGNGLRYILDIPTNQPKSWAPLFHILALFCECSSHIINILDDSELYEQQQPFTIDDLIQISSFLNLFVYRLINADTTDSPEIEPIFQASHKLLTDLYRRDSRRKFTPQDHWLIKEIKISSFVKDLDAGKRVAKNILSLIPHSIPHKERVLIFRRLVMKDQDQSNLERPTFITINRSRIVEDGYQQLARLSPSALKNLVRVQFINDLGLEEAGIDQDGVFKEFLEETFKKVFDPALNLFSSTSEQRLYPSPTSRMHEEHLSLYNFVGKMIGKAVYEGIVVDVPFAGFFLTRVLSQPQCALYSPIDELPSLDPELYKSLTYIKHYDGDFSELDLTFSLDQDFMGKIENHELEPGGRSIPVTKETRVRYIHSVATFRMKTQIEEQTKAFISGFKSIINLNWLSMFSASEFQRLISGDNTPIDLADLRRNTKYFGGFHNNHRVICWLWDILEKDFTPEEHKLFLKFVTSCSKPPLLGFSNLEPPFSIRCVEVGDDQDIGDTVGSVLRGFFALRISDPVDRLPTSSTCFNVLKLPNYQRRSTLREKLRYAIKSNPGFELS